MRVHAGHRTWCLLLLATLAVPASAQSAEDKRFLDQASEQVRKYSETFRDLTATENADMVRFDRTGKVHKERKLRSALIIYRSQKDPRTYSEYRDVEAVDGRELAGHEKRAVKQFGTWATSASVAEELKRISEEGNRYNLGLQTINITLMQGVALWKDCRPGFVIRYLRDEQLNGFRTRVYSFSQTVPCPRVSYSLNLPSLLDQSDKLQRGTLWLESSTARLVREERSVYASPARMPEVEFKLVYCVLDYGASDFEILTPVSIYTESFAFSGKILGRKAEMLPTQSIVQTYGHFSKFEVEVNQAVKDPAAQ
jgi:hypothetical protein